ncbi:MAG: AAA family ATPase [Candidatus Eremiobacteraeota bacterium]|nr:AAA family ATPase [Candidatus Eremiobacteraeota bacterium]
MPVRFVAAPPGSGKTTLLRELIAAAGGTSAYLRVTPRENASTLRARMAAALELDATAASSATAFRAALETTAPVQMFLDDVDNAADDCLDELNALFEDAPAHIHFVVAARSRRIVRSARLFVEGAAARMHADMLRFTANELAELCDARAVSYTERELNALLTKADGWATVVSGCVRSAAMDGRSLGQAFERWLEEYGSIFADWVLQEAHKAGHAKTFGRLTSSATLADAADLEALERDGIFVRAEPGRYALLPVVRDVCASGDVVAMGPTFAQSTTSMTVQVLGEMDARIGGCKVEWMRRRDAQIFKYVLLKPEGSATRDELLAAFWPDRERQQALGALRTSCSNIRQALRAAVGQAQAAKYFHADGEVAVAKNNVIVDVQRFTSYVAAGDASMENGDLSNAVSNFQAAYDLYHGPLLLDVANAHYTHLAGSVEEMFARTAAYLKGRQIFAARALAQ